VVAHYFEGDDHERFAPPLMSRQFTRSAKDTPEAPPPPAPPAATENG